MAPACATQRDAALASEIGAAWAVFVRGQLDVREPWPPYSGRAAAITLRLETFSPRLSSAIQAAVAASGRVFTRSTPRWWDRASAK